jgi:hypothetical protein
MVKNGWHRKFDDPRVLADGKKLVTLKDAIEHLSKTTLKKDHNHPKVLTAATILTKAEGRDFMMHAHIATLRALHRDEERVFKTGEKKTHRGKRKLARDR